MGSGTIRHRVCTAIASALIPLAGACGSGDLEVGVNAAKDGGALGDGGVLLGAGDGGTSPTSFCGGSGPAIPVGPGECSGDLAKRTFRFAICACTNINFSGTVTTDARSSASGQASHAAGSVGVDGTYHGASSATRIDGSLWTQGDTGVSGHDVAGDLQCGGNLVIDGATHVHHDAFVNGSIQGAMTIDGVLHVPVGAPHTGATAAGGTVEGAVTIPPPCDCSAPLDIGAIVDTFAKANDDAAIGFAPDALAQVSAATTLTLPCGRFFVESVAGAAPLTIHVTGRAVLAVRGSLIHQATALTFAVDPGAELDLFVGGDALFSGGVHIGDSTRPAATRVYVGGAFGYDGPLDLAANLYVPHGAFTTTTPQTELWGSLFAKDIGVTGDLTVHYDPAILDVDGCAPPGHACTSCHDCANPSPSCNGGACGPCGSDSDCCPPLHCNAGACVADIR